MFLINDEGIITMFKGDYVEFEVTLVLADEDGNETGHPYEMQEGDVLTFSVRRRPGLQYPVEFSTSSTTNKIIIVPADTANMEVGKYSADIQLTHSGGRISTVFPDLNNLTEAQRSRIRPWNNFILTGEVTTDEH